VPEVQAETCDRAEGTPHEDRDRKGRKWSADRVSPATFYVACRSSSGWGLLYVSEGGKEFTHALESAGSAGPGGFASGTRVTHAVLIRGVRALSMPREDFPEASAAAAGRHPGCLSLTGRLLPSRAMPRFAPGGC
jgi:hypothetical protein